jgi:hypothetical protein
LAAKAFAPAAATATAIRPTATFRAKAYLSFMQNPFFWVKNTEKQACRLSHQQKICPDAG